MPFVDDKQAMARKAWPIASDMTFRYDVLSPALQKMFGASASAHQDASLRLRGNAILAKADPSSRIALWVSLDGTSVMPGKMLYDEEATKGFYQDRIDVEMSVCRKDSAGHWKPIAQMKLVSDGPQTYNGTGSVSSSVSFSFSEGGNVGFFGGTPTGGVNAGVGASESHSFSRSLQDFIVDNDSTGDTAKHTYRMNESTGCSYSKPTDLVRGIAQDLSFSESFYGAHVFDPPDLALHDFPVISQAVWQATDADMIEEDAHLCIYVTQHVYIVEGTNTGFKTKAHVVSGQAGTWMLWNPVPFVELKSLAGAMI